MQTQQLKKAIIYARVSTDEQAEKGYSIGIQIDRVRSYCLARNIEVIEVFKEDFTAKNGFNRPEYNKLKEYLKSSKNSVDYVLFTQWSRFSRDAMSSYNEIERLRKLSIEANAVEQWTNISTPEDRYVLSFYLTAPQVENERLALRVKDAIIQGRKEGKYMGKAPYGYSNDKATKLITVNEQTSKIVIFCFEKFGEGIYTAEEVRKMGVEKGLKLGKQSFLNMLKNKAYIGKVQVPKHNNNPAYWILGLHKPLINVSLFELVQNILDGKKKPYKGNCKTDEIILVGFILCPECGKLLTGSGSKGNGGIYHYYHCQRKYGCKYAARASQMNIKFIDYLKEFEPKPEILALYKKILSEEFAMRFGEQEVTKAEIKKK